MTTATRRAPAGQGFVTAETAELFRLGRGQAIPADALVPIGLRLLTFLDFAAEHVSRKLKDAVNALLDPEIRGRFGADPLPELDPAVTA